MHLAWLSLTTLASLTSRVTKATFGHLCEKIDRKLTGWKSKYLSLAGRITLAKSTISTMACYSMQTAKIPRSICEDIDKKTRRFIWGGSDDKRGVHLISWETLQKPTLQGGIRVRSAKQANAAFLTKLGWRVLSEPDKLWSRVIRYKYYKGRCGVDMFESKRGMSNVWAGITENATFLGDGIQTAVGNGNATLFWVHKWASETPLFELVTQPIPPEIAGATVGEMWESDVGWKWDTFAQYLPQDVLKLIQAHELKDDPNMGDLIYWKSSSKGKFTIKYVLRIIRKESDDLDDEIWHMVWHAPVQQRIRTFLWLDAMTS